MTDGLPSLAPRLSYDAADVELVISALANEIAALRDALSAAERRVDEAERRAAVNDADVTMLGRAMLLVRRLSDEILAEARVEAAEITAAARAERVALPVTPPNATAPLALPHWSNASRVDEEDPAEFFRSLRATGAAIGDDAWLAGVPVL